MRRSHGSVLFNRAALHTAPIVLLREKGPRGKPGRRDGAACDVTHPAPLLQLGIGAGGTTDAAVPARLAAPGGGGAG